MIITKIKSLIIVFLLLMIMFTGCEIYGVEDPGDNGAPEQPEQVTLKASDFFPFENDVFMKYRGEGNEFAEFETYVDFIRNNAMQIRSANPGTTSVNVYMIEEGTLKRVYFEGETYYRLDFTQSRNREEILIKEPIKKGTSWTLEENTTRSITAIDMDIRVPHGEYKAIEVTTDGQNSIVRNYYVKGLGLVKTQFVSKENTDTVVTSELETVRKGPATFRTRLYFPDFTNDRMVYIDRDVEFATNRETREIFEQELRRVPQEDNLTPLLGPNTKILGITMKREEGAVIMDFSSEIITEMNAGAGLESMILTSIVNTMGEYFQVEKVGITVDGKPYSSGHIMLGEDEYITVKTEGIIEYNQ